MGAMTVPQSEASNATPASLLLRLRRPSETRAWDTFVDLYTPLIYRWTRGVGLRGADADDLVQDVFVLLLVKLPEFRYDRHGSFRAWLRTVTLNKWREGLRRRGAAVRQLDDDAAAQLAGRDDGDVFAEEEYRRVIAGRALQLMQAEFSDAVWKAGWAMLTSDRRAADIAAELGVSTDSVYTAKYRVLRRLREQLDGLLD
jgi:RNA polymerase sigma-70 factor (ECF subfamily)